MVALLRRKIRLRQLILFVVFTSVFFVLVTYSFAPTNTNSRPSNRLSSLDRINFLNQDNYHPACVSRQRSPSSSRAQVMDTADIFPHLDFDAHGIGGFWNRTFEEKYRRIKETWKDNPLHIIVVPHSHVDPGWLRTFDEYFNVHVQSILNHMVTFLNKTPEFTFVWTEISFFSKWWDRINAESKNIVMKLLQNGQLEITTGGWVMADEATTHYWSIIDQLSEGHQWLKWSVGITPSYSWSVDVFGHSSTMPLLLSSAGMEGMVILRTHYAWKTFLASSQQFDFLWVADEKEILCHMAPSDLYSFKHVCGPNPSKCLEFDFRKIRGEYSESLATDISYENIRPKAERLLKQYGRYASLFPHNVLLVPLGDDFRYDHELEWEQQYSNYIKLFTYINKRPEFHAHIRFGTVADYFHTVSERLGSTDFASFSGDFFPYADIYAQGVPSYWTGFYSTRPFLKCLSRELEHWLRASEILYSFARSKVQDFDREKFESEYAYLVNVRQALALFQHHDAITGTSRTNVVEDYARKLHVAVTEAMGIAAHSAQYIIMEPHAMKVPWTSQLYPDVLRPDVYGLTKKVVIPISGKGRTIVLFNSLTVRIRNIVRVRVKSPYITVFDETGAKVQSQINPVWNASMGMMTNVFEVLFVSDVGPLSFVTYKLMRVTKDNWDHSSGAKISLNIDDQNQFFQKTSHSAFGFEWYRQKTTSLSLDSPSIKATFSGSGLLKGIYLKHEDISKKVEAGFYTYVSRPRRSGAYLFHPLEDNPTPLQNLSHILPLARIVRGPLISEITFSQMPGVSLTTRLFHFEGSQNHLEMESFYDISGFNPGLELVLRITTDINSGNFFYTDSNGLRFLKRERVPKLRVQGNYYPATSATYIQDKSARLNVLMADSHGVTSPASGSLEIMLDRRMLYDDGRGMNEGVMDNRPTISKFRLILEKYDKNEKTQLTWRTQHSSLTLLYPLLIFVVEYSSSSRVLVPAKAFATYDWPVHLVNLRTLPISWGDYAFPSNSSHVIVLRTNQDPCAWKLRDYLHINFTSIEETSLTGVRKLKVTNSSEHWWTFKAFNVTFQ